MTPGIRYSPTFSGWWSAILLALGGLGTLALKYYTALKNAQTQEEKEQLKAKIYDDYHNGLITLEEYQILLGSGGYTDEKYLEQKMWENWWNKYKYYVIGGGAGVFILIMFGMMRK